jgi:hypothetical protein
MEYSKFKSLLRRMVVVPMLVTAALAGLLLWETFDLNRSLQRVDHTDRVLDQSGHLLKLLVDMESAKLGYIATGDETFLVPYLDGTKRFDLEFQALFPLVADSPTQQQRLKDVYAGYQESEEYDSRIIALRRAGKTDPTLIENQLREHKIGQPRLWRSFGHSRTTRLDRKRSATKRCNLTLSIRSARARSHPAGIAAIVMDIISSDAISADNCSLKNKCFRSVPKTPPAR